MGSSGSGRFGTYRIGQGDISGGIGVGAGGGIGGGEVECPTTISNIRLEDVATSDFFVHDNTVPANGMPVHLSSEIYKGRLVVKSSATDEIIGNLPTQYNRLMTCIKKGMNYTGSVVSSGTSPIPFVVVTLHA